MLERVHRQARRPARRPVDGADRRGEGRRVRARSSHQVAGGSGTLRVPGHGRDRDGALPGARRQHHDAAELRVLDGAGLARLDREGRRQPRQPAAVRHELGVRGPQRDPVGVEDRARRMTRASPRNVQPAARAHTAAGHGRDRRRLGARGRGRGDRHRRRLHHDALIEQRPAAVGWRCLLFLVAWQAMIAAMMLPSSLPLIRLFARRQLEAGARAARVRAAFLGGYAAVWTLFGGLAFLADVGVHRTVDATPWLARPPVADRRRRAGDRRRVPVLGAEGPLPVEVPASGAVPARALPPRRRRRLQARVRARHSSASAAAGR